MDLTSGNRRQFLESSAALIGSGWATMNLPVLTALAAWARTAAAAQAPFTTLTPSQARAMEAFAAQIVPSNASGPGAREAGAIWFIDRALGSYFPEMKEQVVSGLGDLDARARRRVRGVAGFADLAPSDQVRIMRQIEDTPFFFTARMLTVMGVFSDPRHGGNREHAGEQILGIEHKPSYQPPFGWYDAEAARGRS